MMWGTPFTESCFFLEGDRGDKISQIVILLFCAALRQFADDDFGDTACSAG